MGESTQRDNTGNELDDQLVKEAACDKNLQTIYHKISQKFSEKRTNVPGIQKWQSEWDNTNKGALTKPSSR
jgi:hypothetical protein